MLNPKLQDTDCVTDAEFSVLMLGYITHRVVDFDVGERRYVNPHCLSDDIPCAPNGEGGCVACDNFLPAMLRPQAY